MVKKKVANAALQRWVSREMSALPNGTKFSVYLQKIVVLFLFEFELGGRGLSRLGLF